MRVDLPLWVKVAAAGALVVALVAGQRAYEARLIGKGDAAGYARAKGEWARDEARIKADAESKAAAETLRARAETAALQSKFDQLAERQHEERIQHDIATNIAVAAALAGTERLSIPVAAAVPGAVCEGRAAEDSAVGAGAAPEARADLVPAASATVLRFGGDYGQLVRDYNAVLERYEAARAICNAD